MRYTIKADRQYKVWYRETVTVEADSYEEAVKRVENGDFDDHLECTEILYDTETPVSSQYEVMEVTDSNDNVLLAK